MARYSLVFRAIAAAWPTGSSVRYCVRPYGAAVLWLREETGDRVGLQTPTCTECTRLRSELSRRKAHVVRLQELCKSYLEVANRYRQALEDSVAQANAEAVTQQLVDADMHAASVNLVVQQPAGAASPTSAVPATPARTAPAPPTAAAVDEGPTQHTPALWPPPPSQHMRSTLVPSQDPGQDDVFAPAVDDEPTAPAPAAAAVAPFPSASPDDHVPQPPIPASATGPSPAAVFHDDVDTEPDEPPVDDVALAPTQVAPPHCYTETRRRIESVSTECCDEPAQADPDPTQPSAQDDTPDGYSSEGLSQEWQALADDAMDAMFDMMQQDSTDDGRGSGGVKRKLFQVAAAAAAAAAAVAVQIETRPDSPVAPPATPHDGTEQSLKRSQSAAARLQSQPSQSPDVAPSKPALPNTSPVSRRKRGQDDSFKSSEPGSKPLVRNRSVVTGSAGWVQRTPVGGDTIRAVAVASATTAAQPTPQARQTVMTDFAPPQSTPRPSRLVGNMHMAVYDGAYARVRQRTGTADEDASRGTSAHPFREVVRNQAERAKLTGVACNLCEEFYATLPPEVAAKCRQQSSRHRHKFDMPSTPPGYWDLD